MQIARIDGVLADDGDQRRAIVGCRPVRSSSGSDGSWCWPRRPVPQSCPWALSGVEEQRILDARERTNWGPMRLQAITGRHRATIWRVLKRHGVSRRRRAGRQTFKRFEWSQPGALLHIDAY